MNINCIICSDLFLPTSAIYVTKCGHLFHYTCLVQWIERSKTCPQCRNKTNEKSIFRVFFNVITSEGIEDDAVTLQNKLDASNLQLRLKESHVKATEEKIFAVTSEKLILEDECAKLKKEMDKISAGFSNLKEQLKFYKDKVKYIEKVEDEIQKLKETMRSKEQAYKAITGGFDDAAEIINSTSCPKTLAMISTSLKKELQLVEKKKNNYFTLMKRVENELHSCKKELSAVKFERDKLKNDISAHKHCEQEIQTMKDKIAEMMETSRIVDPSLVRVATESPAPAISRRKFNSSSSSDSPSIADRVKEIKESDSPYLKIKSNSMGSMLKARELSSKFGSSSSVSIFKKALSQTSIDDISQIKKPLADYSYDGFGGHSKDEKFPVPRPSTGIKRTKSQMSSKKFKKLAKPNKKIDDFLDISTID